jgi:hypothetical protein
MPAVVATNIQDVCVQFDWATRRREGEAAQSSGLSVLVRSRARCRLSCRVHLLRQKRPTTVAGTTTPKGINHTGENCLRNAAYAHRHVHLRH